MVKNIKHVSKIDCYGSKKNRTCNLDRGGLEDVEDVRITRIVLTNPSRLQEIDFHVFANCTLIGTILHCK